jgi:hypothetical protein
VITIGCGFVFCLMGCVRYLLCVMLLCCCILSVCVVSLIRIFLLSLLIFPTRHYKYIRVISYYYTQPLSPPAPTVCSSVWRNLIQNPNVSPATPQSVCFLCTCVSVIRHTVDTLVPCSLFSHRSILSRVSPVKQTVYHSVNCQLRFLCLDKR